MTTLPKLVDLKAGGVNRDYTTIYADLARLIPHYTPEWTYTGDNDFGIVLLQLMAYMGHHLHHRADATLRDRSLYSCEHVELVRELAEWVGYRAKRATAAETTLTVRLAAAQSVAVTIPAWSVFTASRPDGTVYFENPEPLTIPAGATSGTVVVVEGRRNVGRYLGATQGLPFEPFYVDAADVIFNWQPSDFVVTVGDAEATLFEYPSDATADDLAYTVRQLRDGRLELRFGNGTYGKLVPTGAAVGITYRTGGGRRGNVPAGTVTQVVSSLVVDGTEISLSCTNAARASGGDVAEPIADIKRNAPAFFKAQNRLVTAADYEQAALSVPGVFQCKAVASGVGGVLLYIVPQGAQDGDVLTDELRSRILRRVNAQRTCPDVVSVRQATLVPIDVTLDLHIYANQRRAVVADRVLKLFLDPGGILHFASGNLGKALRLSDMINLVEDVAGVDYVDVQLYTLRPRLELRGAMGNGALTSDGVTLGLTALEQTWELAFTSPLTYVVTGSVSGRQATTGDVGVAYANDANDVMWTVAAGAQPFAAGDRGLIRVGRPAWNITLLPYEFPVAGKILLPVPS